MSFHRIHRPRAAAVLAAGLALGAALIGGPARASDNVFWSIGVTPAPGVVVGASNLPPVTYAPARVVYAPPPVVYIPPVMGQVYPVYLRPVPVRVGPSRHGHGHAFKQGRGHERGHGHGHRWGG